METIPFRTLTICGIEELSAPREHSVTHVLSLLDPEWPELDAFEAYGDHHRTTLRFHDIIDPLPGKVMPTPDHVAAILRFGTELADSGAGLQDGHLLVHCHMGVSRSTAAMLSLLAQALPEEEEDRLFARLRHIRPQAWPNSLMIGYADDFLGRKGRLTAALRRHYGHQIKHEPSFVDWMSSLGRSRELEMAVVA
ncbi:tyrosine phosphatase family protein [Telmatospirillum sp. J64-1]|uniref:tyrosine phosphatase family protein n=1 Tax=Telmatospirillum sp. J64-1 TaxID=2502183 RepID=UPI00115DECCD|nr:protein-tyrosine-phosphatase [Telmatospirillum sp. J64-1]